jgi:hypothetical protein
MYIAAVHVTIKWIELYTYMAWDFLLHFTQAD